MDTMHTNYLLEWAIHDLALRSWALIICAKQADLQWFLQAMRNFSPKPHEMNWLYNIELFFPAQVVKMINISLNLKVMKNRHTTVKRLQKIRVSRFRRRAPVKKILSHLCSRLRSPGALLQWHGWPSDRGTEEGASLIPSKWQERSPKVSTEQHSRQQWHRWEDLTPTLSIYIVAITHNKSVLKSFFFFMKIDKRLMTYSR